MLTHHTKQLNDLCGAMTQALVQDDRAVRGGGGVQRYNVACSTQSCEYDYNLADSWVGANRWAMLTRQYVNGPALEDWLGLIESKLTKKKAHGVAFLRSQVVKPRGTKRISRQWGSCMIGWSFRLFPVPTLTMHSRSTYLGFLAPLDVGVAAILAEEAGTIVGLQPSEIQFAWFLEQETFHFLRSMPWWFTSPLAEDARIHRGPGVKGGERMITRFREMDRRGVLYGDMAYAQERRYRMKLHSQLPDGLHEKFLGVGKHAEVKTNPILPAAWISKLPLVVTESSDDYVERGFLDEDD